MYISGDLSCTYYCSCNQSASDNNHLATCTYPNTRNNDIGSSDLFCPYPPSVPLTDDPITRGKPLDYISYYMDQHLLDLADNQIDTIEFFRRYNAGFLISRHESAMSLCGSNYVRGVNDTMADTEDLMCMMFGTTPLVRAERFFNDSLYRITDTIINIDLNCIADHDQTPYYNTVVGCTIRDLTTEYLDRPKYPECNEISLDIERILERDPDDDDNEFRYVIDRLRLVVENETTNLSLYNGTIFRVDGAVRESAILYTVPNGYNSTFGRQYAEFPNSDITGATIYYNNQVIILTNSLPF